MTTVMAVKNKCACKAGANEAGAANPSPEAVRPNLWTNPEAARLFVEEAFRKAGKPIPQVMDGQAFIQASYLAKGKPIPEEFARQPVTVEQMTNTIAEIKRLGDSLPGPEPVQFALPTPSDAALSADVFPEDTKNPLGAPRGDAKVMRRRRATELERAVRAARKRVGRGSPAERAKWDAELYQLSAELEAIREAERRERDEYKKF